MEVIGEGPEVMEWKEPFKYFNISSNNVIS